MTQREKRNNEDQKFNNWINLIKWAVVLPRRVNSKRNISRSSDRLSRTRAGAKAMRISRKKSQVASRAIFMWRKRLAISSIKSHNDEMQERARPWWTCITQR